MSFDEWQQQNIAVEDKPKDGFESWQAQNASQPITRPKENPIESAAHAKDAWDVSSKNPEIPLSKAKQYTTPPDKVEPKDKAIAETMNALVESKPVNYGNWGIAYPQQDASMYYDVTSKWHGSWGAMAKNLDHIMGWMEKWGERITGIESDFDYQTGKKMTPEEVAAANRDFAKKHPDVAAFMKQYGLAPGEFFANAAAESNAKRDYYAQKALEKGPNFTRDIISEIGGLPVGAIDWFLNIPYAFVKGEAESQARGEGEISQLYYGLYEATVRGVLGKIFDGLSSYSRHEKAAAMGALFTGQAASQGAGVKESVKAGFVGTFIGATGGEKGNPDLFEDFKIKQDKALEYGEQVLRSQGAEPDYAEKSEEIKSAEDLKPIPNEPEKASGVTANAKSPEEPANTPAATETPTEIPKPENPQLFSIMNDWVDARRKVNGMEPLKEKMRESNPEVWAKADEEMQRNPNVGDELIKELNGKIRPTNKVEEMILAHKLVEADVDLADLSAQLNKAIEDGDEEQTDNLRKRFGLAYDKYKNISDLTDATGGEIAGALQIRKSLFTSDYTFAGTVKRIMMDKGSELSDDELDEVRNTTQEIADLEAQPGKADEEALKNFYAARKAAEGRPVRITPDTPGFGSRNKVFTKQMADLAIANLRRITFDSASAGINPQGLVELSKLVGYYTEGGIRELPEITRIIVNKLGDKFEPYIAKAWADVRSELSKMRKADAQEKMRGVLARAEDGTVEDIGKHIQNLAYSAIESGIEGLKPVTEEVYNTIKDFIPDVTRRDIIDAISGIGKFKPLSKDPIMAKLRDIKQQALQLGKIRKLREGEPIPKTGLERQPLSEKGRRLAKLVEEAKKKYPVESTDKDVQLQSALDRRKTYYANQISDIEREIDTRQKTIKERRLPPTDDELKALVAKRDELAKQRDEIFGKPELTDQQRLDRAIKVAERTQEQWERKLENAKKGIFKEEKETKDLPASAKLESIENHTNTLREEVKHLKDLANPKKSAEEVWQQSYAANLARQEERLRAKLASGDFAPAPKKGLKYKLGPEEQARQFRISELKEKLDQMAYNYRMAHRTWTEKTLGFLRDLRLFNVLSWPTVFPKLGTMAVMRSLVMTPTVELITSFTRKLPFFKELAEGAPRYGEGFSIGTFGRAKISTFKRLWKDLDDAVRTGQTDITRIARKYPRNSRSLLALAANLHLAMKTFSLDDEFFQSLERHIRWNEKNNVNVRNPVEQKRIMAAAAQDAMEAILQGIDSTLSQMNRNFVSWASRNDPKTGKPRLYRQLLQAIVQNRVPIINVPANIHNEFLLLNFGLFTGNVNALRAWLRGVDKTTPEQKDAIFRHIAYGTMGTLGVGLFGALNYKNIEPFYYPGQPKDKPKSSIWERAFYHTPIGMQVRFWASVRWSMDELMKEKGVSPTERFGISLWRAFTGEAESIPFVRESLDISKIYGAKGVKALEGYVDEFIKSEFIPGVSQWEARREDKDKRGNVITRKPSNLKEHLETGIPVLRKNVPEKKE